MELSLDQETVDRLKPLSVTHENTLIYSALKSSMDNNEQLRKSLEEAADTIDKQTDLIQNLMEVIHELQRRFYV
jgi:hypothetical protein